MNMTNGLKRLLLATVALAGLGGCAHMSPQERNTAVGAALGGVAGSILTDQSGLGTVGGAVVGGYIGNQIRR